MVGPQLLGGGEDPAVPDTGRLTNIMTTAIN